MIAQNVADSFLNVSHLHNQLMTQKVKHKASRKEHIFGSIA